jgi:lysophospholipase L1-like esterase
MEFINYIEDKYYVDKWTVENIHVWPFIRIKLGLYISYYNQNKMTKEEEKNQLSRENVEFEEIKPNIIDEWLNKNYDAVFLTHTGAKTNVEGVWYDKFCDYLIEQFENLGEKSLILEYTTSDRYKGKVNIESYRISEEVNYYLNQNYNDEKYNKFNCNLDKYDMFFKEMFEFFKSIKYEMPAFTVDWIISEFKQIRIIADYFKNILIRTNPKVAFVVCYYTNIGFAFNLACRELKIRSIDIQHGYTTKYHFSYSNWRKVPSDGYGLLPSFFWCWSKEEASIIEKWTANNQNSHSVLVGGNTWLALWQNIKAKTHVHSNSIYNKQNNGKHVKILYTQSSIMDDFIFEAIEKSPTEWVWIIRFHPLIQKKYKNNLIDKLKKLNNKNIEWETDDIPIFALIENIDVNVTTSSSTVIEAQYFGKKSIVTDKYGKEMYNNLIHNGLVRTSYNCEELIQSIKIQLNYNKINIEPQEVFDKIYITLRELKNYIKSNYNTKNNNDDIYNLIEYNYKNCIEKCIVFKKYDRLLEYYNLVENEEVFKVLLDNILNRDDLKKFILNKHLINIVYKLRDSKIKSAFHILLINKIISIEECFNITKKVKNIQNKFQYIRLSKCILFEVLKYISYNLVDYRDEYFYVFQQYLNVSFQYIEYIYNIDEVLINSETTLDSETKFIIYMYLYKKNSIGCSNLLAKAKKQLPCFKIFDKKYKIEIIGDSFGMPRNFRNNSDVEVMYEETYPQLLKELYKNNYIINSCHRANNTFWLIKNHLSETILNRPDYVIIQLGIVDCWLKKKDYHNELYPDFSGKNPWVTEDEYINNIKLFIDYTFQHVNNLKEIFILNISKAKNDQYKAYPGSYEQTIKYNKQLDELNKMKKVHVIDIYEIFEKKLEEVLCSDGLHPNKLGNIMIANKIFDVLNKYIPKDYIECKSYS